MDPAGISVFGTGNWSFTGPGDPRSQQRIDDTEAKRLLQEGQLEATQEMRLAHPHLQTALDQL